MSGDAARVQALQRLMRTPIWAVERGEPGGDAAARAQDFVTGVRRHLFTIDAVLGRHLPHGIARVEPRLLEALRIGAFQLLYEPQVARPLVVASTVALAGASSKKRGFLNAVLRRIAGEIRDETGAPPRRSPDCVVVGARAWVRFPEPVLPDPDTDLVAHLSAQFSQTPWLVETLMRDVGDEIDDLLLALMLPLPVAVRANALRTNAADAEAALVAAGASVLRRFGDVLEIRYPGPLTACAPFRDGLVTVQDVVASRVAPFVGPAPGERILDLCAGVGGKSIHLSELAGGSAEIVAADVSPERLGKLEENLVRLGTPGVRPLPIEADAMLPGPFDRVLVDAPCSNSGVLMKRIGARYRQEQDAVVALARKELELLRRGGSAVRPGGVLVYSTCSILPQENAGVVERFLGDRGGGFVLEQSELAYPHRTGRDGGFMARFVRA